MRYIFIIFNKLLTIVCCVLLGSLSVSFAQKPAAPDKEIVELVKVTQSTPSGSLSIKGYRLEKVIFPEPIELPNRKEPLKYGFRIVIETETRLPVAAFTIWMDNKPLQSSVIGPYEVASIINKSTLPDGATLGLSKSRENSIAFRSVLSENLKVPSEYVSSAEEIREREPVITLKRHNTRYPMIYMTIKLDGTNCFIGGTMIGITIGETPLRTTCGDTEFVGFILESEFSKIRDGEEIKVVFGLENPTEISAGYLNKSILENQ